MNEPIWIEWIGLWGSGKTTSINKIYNMLEGHQLSIKRTNSFFKKKKKLRRFLSLVGLLRNSSTSIKLFYLFIFIYIKAKLKRDIIVIDEIYSFFSCYLARTSIIRSKKVNIFLWEGEFHLLPLIEMNNKSIDQIIDLLLSVNKNRPIRFIIMNIDLGLVKSRIQHDHKSGKNIRFNENDLQKAIDKVEKIYATQKYIVDKLIEKGYNIYESDGDIGKIKDYILSSYR
jgi:hypothetical protein